MHNWCKCVDGDLQFTRNGSKGEPKKDKEAWETIYNEYIGMFGLNKLYARMLEAMRKKALAELEYCITGDRFSLTQGEIQESVLKSMLDNKGNGTTIDKTLIHLSKWVGYWLNTKNITTLEYFNLLGEYEKYNKIKDNGEKNK